jgi:hypothetical protein
MVIGRSSGPLFHAAVAQIGLLVWDLALARGFVEIVGAIYVSFSIDVRSVLYTRICMERMTDYSLSSVSAWPCALRTICRVCFVYHYRCSC